LQRATYRDIDGKLEVFHHCLTRVARYRKV